MNSRPGRSIGTVSGILVGTLALIGILLFCFGRCCQAKDDDLWGSEDREEAEARLKWRMYDEGKVKPVRTVIADGKAAIPNVTI